MLPSSQRERRVSRLNRTGNNTTGWARRLTALLVTACLVMAMALPVYAEEDLLPDAPGEVELLEDEQGTASGEDTVPPEQNAATPVPDAATPEPEQSAEPEQPAPTETPEPTAEPTPTPEPAATATATPVPTVTPTVTPTATPEPTEQPQKMYAAKSVDNVQAASEGGVPDTYTLYFAVPTKWKDYTKVKIYAVDGKDSNTYHKYFLDMLEVGETKDQRKIYSVVLDHQKHYQYGGLNGLEFRGYNGDAIADENPAYKVVIAQVDNNNNPPWMTFNSGDHYIGGNYYDGNKNKGDGWNRDDWTTYTVGHKLFAGEKMAFENKTSKTLTNVKAWFYELDEETGKLNPIGGPISLNSDGLDSGIASGSTATFDIPNDFCSFVRFTAGDDNTGISEYYNFYNEKVTGENQKRFQYSEQCYCYMYNGPKDATWGRPGAIRIYYDATFSKLLTTGANDTGGDYSIPKANSKETIYFRIKGDGVESESGTLVKDGTNENLYYIDIPQGYSSIIFSGEKIDGDEETKRHGLSTEWLPIPTDDKNCFYADTNDDAVYKDTTRGGYWAPKGTLRDAEEWKKTESGKQTEVVDIASVPFTEEANTKYVTSTLYDYYTDYELNGMNRDNYGGWTGESHRTWVPFREFDQALSDYYRDANAQYPIYTGHFQPDNGHEFSQIAETLKLFGYTNVNRFMAINNSQYNEDHNGNNHIYYAYQGLVANTTSTGNADGAPLLNGTTSAVEPHFNKEFLLGKNSKNAKLGEVYDNVAFPFTKNQIFDEDQGVDYWCFDSKDTTLYLKQNSEQNSDSKYFLQESTDNRERSVNVNASSSPQGHYGYFPFNETADPGVASTYNYGFGTKLQMDFTLTDDGKVETKNADGTKGRTSIKFFFSGDDDVWVFIDGKLALDVGGAHGKVSGLLEFGKADDKNNSVTAYVSKVKKGGTSGNDKDGNNPVKAVTYKGETISFYAESTPLVAENTPLVLAKGQKHTLTMYYMERGMWESNMAVAFNFPDNNELQVQKEVDLTNVTDDDFKKCFTGQKIFNFTIQNQATHYGEKKAVGPDESGTQSKVVDLDADVISIAPAIAGSEDYIFKKEQNQWPDPEQGSGQNTEKVLHWYARYTDTQSAAREKRRGILTLGNPINIENMRFLTFQVYVGSNDGGGGDLFLNNLYLELLDDQNPAVQKGSLDTSGINGATYGSVEVKPDQWVTVKLDLHKMKEKGKFSGNVTTIRVGDNYSRNIYFRNFTFIPKAVPSKMTGFTTDQEKIPDYGSAKSGNLENAKYAQYTSTEDTDTQLVDEDGRFVLEAGETVTFSDQFRRGSYISLKEELNQNLYDTKWTVYENGQKVTSMEGGKSVSLSDPTPPLIEQNGSGPDDGRTENITDKTEQESGGVQNNYNGKKPTTANTIVFRSYKDPDETSSTLTKLKVKYVNTVKTGGLKIQKKAADGEDENIKGIYTFKVTFSDVGGAGLEKKPIEKPVTIDMSQGNTGTITGIPVGTRYTIEEVETSDGSTLQSVTVPDGQYAHVIGKTMVEGEIVESNNPNDLEVTAIFTNTKRKLINIEFNKLWEDADGTDLSTKKPPDTIYIQLQRRLKNGTGYTDWEPVNYPTADSPDYVTINRDDYGWKCIFNNLDQYPINGSADNNYIYRIVEGTVENGKFKQAAEDGTITINGNTYVVKAKATPKSETNNAGSSTGNTATVTPDGTITGGSGKIELTNKLQNPKFGLNIIKKDAEKGENNKEVFLKDVEFKLEKLRAEKTTEGKTQYTVDTGYKFSSNNKNYLTGITGTDGEITNNPFKNLEPGRYRLTETKAHPGYNLLSKSIDIEFTQDGKYKIDDGTAKNATGDAASGYTVTLTVLNRKTPELPHTGADAPSLWLLIGMPLAVAGLLIFTFRYNRKGGRRH